MRPVTAFDSIITEPIGLRPAFGRTIVSAEQQVVERQGDGEIPVDMLALSRVVPMVVFRRSDNLA